jgi:hypothetical protein
MLRELHIAGALLEKIDSATFWISHNRKSVERSIHLLRLSAGDV